MSAEVLLGDCREVMAGMQADSVDAIVCDPPYGLKFMGKGWDRGVPGVEFWTEAIRVIKPGSSLLAFGGTRTFHRLACAIEDAGFQIGDAIGSLNTGDDEAAVRDVWLSAERSGLVGWMYGSGFPKHASKLKPAWEPIIMARRPAPKATPLNIDVCRIATCEEIEPFGSPRKSVGGIMNKTDEPLKPFTQHILGRWPANVILDEEAAAALDSEAGSLTSGKPAGIKAGGKLNCYGTFAGGIPVTGYGDTGGASRFFYTAKASRSERNAGLEGFEERRVIHQAQTLNNGSGNLRNGDGLPSKTRNHHPTVKPVAVMRWLCKLVTPQNGIILDPFCGSGTTGVAATLEGFRFVGIENEPEYAEIARKRIHETPPSLFGEVA